MGYYSSFKLSTTNKGKDIIEKQLSDFIGTFYKVEVDDGENYILAGDDLKMYDVFPEIQKLNEVRKELLKKEIDFEYIRIGEELDDVEEEYHNYQGSCKSLGVRREIEIYDF